MKLEGKFFSLESFPEEKFFIFSLANNILMKSIH